MQYGQRNKMGNVIKFPSNYKPENPPEVDTKAAETRENFAWCEQLAEGIMYSCLKNFQSNGCNIVEESTIAQLSFLAEVIKSVAFHEKDIHHPLQDLADRFVSLQNTKTPDGGPAIKGDFDVLSLNEWMERNDEFDDLNLPDPPEPVAS